VASFEGTPFSSLKTPVFSGPKSTCRIFEICTTVAPVPAYFAFAPSLKTPRFSAQNRCFKYFPAYPPSSASFSSVYGIGTVWTPAQVRRGIMAARSYLRIVTRGSEDLFGPSSCLGSATSRTCWRSRKRNFWRAISPACPSSPFLPALARADELAFVRMAPTMAKQKPGAQDTKTAEARKLLALAAL